MTATSAITRTRAVGILVTLLGLAGSGMAQDITFFVTQTALGTRQSILYRFSSTLPVTASSIGPVSMFQLTAGLPGLTTVPAGSATT